SAAMDCKAASRMVPLKKQRIEISHVCMACPHTSGGATQPDAKLGYASRSKHRGKPPNFSCIYTPFAQFIGVCSSAKTCEIDENLRFVSDSTSRLQERLIDASALIRPPALQRRTVSSLHSYAALERAPAAMSPVPEPRR